MVPDSLVVGGVMVRGISKRPLPNGVVNDYYWGWDDKKPDAIVQYDVRKAFRRQLIFADMEAA